MLTFSLNELYLVIIFLLLFIIILHGDNKFLKGRLKELEDDRSGDGWRSEALFLRHQVNDKAAEFSEETPNMSTQQTVNLKVEKELHSFLCSKAEAEGLSLEEYTANILSKQVNIEEILEDIKANKNNYSLSRVPSDIDYDDYENTSGMDIGCSTVQIGDI